MKKLIVLIIFSLILFQLQAQVSTIENTSIKLSKSRDSLIINFTIVGEVPLNNVHIEVMDSTGNIIDTKTIFGDVANIQPGENKKIIWNMAADGFTKTNTIINAKVVADLIVNSFFEEKIIETPIPTFKPEKEKWMNWWFVAAGVSATGGALSYLKSNALYDEYPSLSETNEANNQHSKIKTYDMLGNIAFGLAGVLGATGVIIQVKHKNKMNDLAIQYQMVNQGSGLSFVYKF